MRPSKRLSASTGIALGVTAILAAAACSSGGSETSPRDGGAESGLVDSRSGGDSTTADAPEIDGRGDGPIAPWDGEADGEVDAAADGSDGAAATSDAGGTDAASTDAGDAAAAGDGAGVLPAVCAAVCAAGQKLCQYQCVSIDDPSCGSVGCDACSLSAGGDGIYSVSCAAGQCVIGSCVPGRADCDGNPQNGCEADLDSPQTCGSCSHQCAAGQVCSDQACATSCAFPQVSCSGACHELDDDPNACNACGTVCQGASPQTITCQPEGPGEISVCGASGGASCTSPTCTNAYPYVYAYPCGNCACAAGFSQCAGACVEVNTDPSNCGACGNVCAAGDICVEGECAAALQVVTTLGNSAGGIAVDGANVYYTDSATNTVWQVDKNSFAKTELATNQPQPGPITFDSSYVYWTSGGGRAVLRAPIGAATPFQVVASTNLIAYSLVVDDTNVYWGEGAEGTGTLYSATKAGGGTPKQLATGTAGIYAQDANNLYSATATWQAIGGYTVSAFALNKTTLAVTYLGLGGYGLWFATDNANFYAIGTGSSNGTGYELYREAKTLGPILADPIPIQPYGTIAAETCGVYWASGTTIYKAVPGGAPPRKLTTAACCATDVALDDSYVYFIDGNAIRRIPK